MDRAGLRRKDVVVPPSKPTTPADKQESQPPNGIQLCGDLTEVPAEGDRHKHVTWFQYPLMVTGHGWISEGLPGPFVDHLEMGNVDCYRLSGDDEVAFRRVVPKGNPLRPQWHLLRAWLFPFATSEGNYRASEAHAILAHLRSRPVKMSPRTNRQFRRRFKLKVAEYSWTVLNRHSLLRYAANRDFGFVRAGLIRRLPHDSKLSARVFG